MHTAAMTQINLDEQMHVTTAAALESLYSNIPQLPALGVGVACSPSTLPSSALLFKLRPVLLATKRAICRTPYTPTAATAIAPMAPAPMSPKV